MSSNRKNAATAALYVAACAAAAAVHADPVLDYTLGVSVEHSDNINRSGTDPVDQDVLIPQATFSANQSGSALELHAAGALEYRDYLGNAFADEFRGLLSGAMAWHISPERLDWVVEDYLGRQPINVFANDAPDNQQRTNVFSTGPTFRARFGSSWRSQVDLRYTNNYAERSKDFNNDRFSVNAHLLRELSQTDAVGVSLGDARTRYDEQVSRAFDYDRRDAYASFQHLGQSFTVQAAAGYSWLDMQRASDRSGALVRATMRWVPSTQTSAGLTLAREFSDASQDLVIEPSQIGNVGIGSGLNGAVVSPQIYVEKRATFDVAHNEERYRFSFAPFVRQMHYIDGNFPNQRSRGFYADFSYYLQPKLWLRAYSGAEHRRYDRLARTDDDLLLGLALNWQRTPHWLWTVQVYRDRRNSNAEFVDYTENAALVSLTYLR